MAKAVARPVRGLVALFLVSSNVMQIAPNFTTLGAPPRASSRISRMTAYATSMRVPTPSISAAQAFTSLPWAEDLEGSDALTQSHHKDTMKVVDTISEQVSVLSKAMTEAQLSEYDRTLSLAIQRLEDQIEATKADLGRDSMEVKSEAQLQWLQDMLQNVEDLQGDLQHVRDAKARVSARMGWESRGFIENMLHAVACALGGHKVVSNSDYPAVGLSGYTGEPSSPLVHQYTSTALHQYTGQSSKML